MTSESGARSEVGDDEAAGAATGLRPSRTTRVRRWLLSLPPATWVTAVVLIALLVSGLFGGLREVDTDPVGALERDRAVSAAPVEVSVTDVYTVREFPGLPATDGAGSVPADQPSAGRFVVVEASVTNTSEATVGSSVLSRAVSLDDATGFVSSKGARVEAAQAPPTLVYTLPEKSAFTRAQPGVTYRVAYLFDQAAEVAAPATITVAVNEHTWREDSLDFSMDWKDPEVRATGRFALRERAAS